MNIDSLAVIGLLGLLAVLIVRGVLWWVAQSRRLDYDIATYSALDLNDLRADEWWVER